jgi:hypothetical protein
MLSEFEQSEYREFVKAEIRQFKAGSISEFGYRSEGNDIKLKIGKNSSMLSYNLWVDELEDDVVGSMKVQTTHFLSVLEACFTNMESDRPWHSLVRKILF